jgi:membrane protease YdiL (CAAX protease family)
MRPAVRAWRYLASADVRGWKQAASPDSLVVAGVVVVDLLLSWLADRTIHGSRGLVALVIHGEYAVRFLCAAAIMLAFTSQRPLVERLGLRRATLAADLRWTAWVMLAGGALMLIAMAVGLLGLEWAGSRLSPPKEAQIPWMQSRAAWLYMLRMGSITVVVAPIVEEVIYRGILFPALVTRMRPWMAITASAMIFAFLHAGPYGRGLFVPIELAGGALLSLAFYLRRSIVPGVLVHAAGNALFLLEPMARVHLYDLAPTLFTPTP